MTDFVLLTMDWYRRNARDLPWRNTQNPYFIWLSEVILQQTRVDQGMKYYFHFTSTYPNIVDLAKASEDEILKSWQGLGYYSRARNLHKTAQQICTEHKGVFPNTYEKLIQLKGIGPYSAAAISSFAFKEPRAVLDGNVFRVLSRYFGIDTPIDTGKGRSEFQALADALLPHDAPDLFNQALMEFGALCCTPKQAQCNICPNSTSCVARIEDRVYTLPIKSKKTKVSTRYLHYFFIQDDGYTYLHQRTENGIWKGLFEFPVVESKSSELSKHELDELGFSVPKSAYFTKHILSHQHLNASFYVLNKLPPYFKHEKRIKQLDLPNFAIPRLIEKFLEQLY